MVNMGKKMKKRYYPKESEKNKTNLKQIEKPLWDIGKLTQNQIYVQKSDFENEKLHVFEKITRPVYNERRVFCLKI